VACIPQMGGTCQWSWTRHPTHMDRIDGERAVEAKRLSRRVVRIFVVLDDLGMLPFQNIPQLLKSAREVLPAVDLVM
jgi:hypothetical protein